MARKDTSELPEVNFSEEGPIRHLHLGSEWIQGSMLVDAPNALVHEYIQRMMAWLLFVEPDSVAQRQALQLGLGAEADERTIDLLVTPESLAGWARAGVSAHMEVTLAGGTEELAVPQSAVVRDGARAIIFRRDPADPDKAIRMEADVGLSDGRWVVIASGVKEGDEIVLGGNFQLMLATSGSTEKAGHFHSDGTFHKGSH